MISGYTAVMFGALFLLTICFFALAFGGSMYLVWKLIFKPDEEPYELLRHWPERYD